MYRQNPILLELLTPAVQALGYELLGIEHLSQGKHSLLRIYIDSEAGIGLDDCERVSEQASGLLDVHDPINGAYQLEVSSPGFDRPLFTLDHFRRFTGHPVKVQLHQKVQGRRKLAGLIRNVSEDKVSIEMEGEIFEIQADNIERARLAE